MVSGVGFQSGDTEQQNAPRTRLVSRGLLMVFLLLLLSGGAWVGLYSWKKSINKGIMELDAQIAATQKEAHAKISDEIGGFIKRAHTVDNELYRGYTTGDVLNEIERIIIQDENGNRVVLRSLEHHSGVYEKNKKTNNSAQANRLSARRGTLTITADADNFDVMAQQIDEFKKSSYFTDVRVGTTDRDDNGRIVFTLTMNVERAEESPYERHNAPQTDMQTDMQTEVNIETVVDPEIPQDVAPAVEPAEQAEQTEQGSAPNVFDEPGV